MISYVFMGTPPFAAEILDQLVQKVGPPRLVVTQPGRPRGRGQKAGPSAVASKAKELSLPLHETSNISAAESFEHLEKVAPDLILVVAFGQILKKNVLDLPKVCCLNIHGSLLPRYRGAAPIQYAILNGDAETGVTIQKMVKQLDAGDIFVQQKMKMIPGETSGELLTRMTPVAVEASVEAFKKIETKQLDFIPQDESQVSFAPKVEKSEAVIDWNKPAQEILNRIYALQPWPVAETLLAGTKLRIFGAAVSDTPLSARTLKTDNKNQILVGCGDGRALSLTEIQLENRKRLQISDFIKGYRDLGDISQIGE